MSTPAEVVADQFDKATSYVTDALAQTETFTNALANAIYASPTISITWTAIDPPSSTTIPDLPPQVDAILDTLEWDQDGSIEGSKPADLSISAPTIDIDDFTEDAPVVDIPDAPALDFGDAPVVDYGSKPVAPTLTEPTLPDDPSITLPDEPTFLALSTPTYGGLDLHPDEAPDTSAITPLQLDAPTPYSYTPGPQYASDLLEALKAVLSNRANSATGLSAAVEQALWDRARAREIQVVAANEAEVTRTNENLGFALPTGALAAQLRKAQQDGIDKISTLSRDIAIKQAELEQDNLKIVVEQGIQLEGRLIDYSYNMERLAFETAKTVAENAVAVHNAGVEKYRALLAYYAEFRATYQALIEAERLKLDEYRAKLQAEQTKADVNRTLVEQYKASIEAQLAFIRIFEAQLQAVKAQVDINQAKVASFGEEIKAYVAGVNGETAKIEAYKINAEAQKTRVESFDAQVRAQLSRVEVFKSQVGAYSAKVQGQGEKARAQLSYYDGVVRAKTSEWEAWSARVRGETSRFDSLTRMSNALLDGYKARTDAVLKVAQQDIERWRVGIGQYEAQQNYTLQAAKINADIVSANRQATLDAAKAGAAIYAQLTGSAMGMIHTSAGVSASASNSVSYSYSNDTEDAAPTVTAV